ncbi:iron complex outermembrane recepter protein [Colwellia chukchiensis]|uniref:Iron complex outermembrane recepter protein n=2 Tax=Colwellia chukchiensis TaxID=641665 RepID=A0A1H7M3S4_9GAMM|nr:iron complex outermembrane recepter protein [Colwellia chukchiensis]
MESRFNKKALVLAMSTALLASAVNAEAIEKNSEAEKVEKITVVGSRVPGRSIQESTVPVDVISAEDLTQSATIGGEVGGLLQANIPSFNMPRQSNSDAGDIVRAAQLRGLNPDQVLVLVNGKRRHNSAVISAESKLGRGAAPVDFNAIPASAIKRIEVLRDGAAAQYGSDAIAGVINIVLKNSSDGGNISVSYGQHMTDFKPTNESINDGKTKILSLNKGLDLGNGFVNISGEFKDRKSTNRAGFDELPTIGFAEWIVPVPASGSPEAAANDALAGQKNYQSGDGEISDISLAYNLAYDVSAEATLYSFGTYADREAQGSNFFRYPVSAANVTSVHPKGYIPTSIANVKDIAMTLGLEGEYAEWELETSLSYGSNTFDDDLKNSINPSLGASSPTSFNRAEYKYSQTVFNLTAAKAFDLGYIPLYFTAGIEARNEDYSTKAGDVESYIAGADTSKRVGSQGGAGLRPEDTVNEDRNSWSVFIDGEFDLSDDVTLSTALRFEDYSDFGTDTNGKVSARWALLDGLALRGAVSTGFRAPSLAQSFYSGSSSSFGDGGSLVQTLNLPVNDVLALANGSSALKAEQSVSRSLGVVYNVDNFNLTVDYYQVDIDDRIALSENISIDNVPDVRAIRFFTNVVDTETKGFDVVASYDLDAWHFMAAYNKNDTEVVNNPDNAVFGIEETNTFETAAPDDKIILSSRWSNEIVSVLVRATRYGDTTRVFDFGDGYEPTQVYSPKWSVDADVQYNVTDDLSVSLGANNLLDEYPDKSIYDISYFGNLPYDGGISPLGINGRFVYVKASYNF